MAAFHAAMLWHFDYAGYHCGYFYDRVERHIAVTLGIMFTCPYTDAPFIWEGARTLRSWRIAGYVWVINAILALWPSRLWG